MKHNKLIRKYRLVREDEPVQMFDWFVSDNLFYEQDSWPAPDKQYNNGWVQIEPGMCDHLLDGHPDNRRAFVFARFVDCVPLTKS